MKLLFDLFPVVLFFVAFKLFDIYTATAVAIAATFLQIGWLKWKRRKVDTMMWISLVIIVVFGGATLALHDETFIKWKPTVLYWLFGVVIAVAQSLFRRNLIRAMLGEQVRMPDGTTGLMVENGDQVSTLMIIFGAGYVAVFGVFVLLYWHAYRQREALELNELEVFDTRVDIRESALNVGIALVSIAIAFIGRGRFAFLSGITYMLNGILSPLHGTLMGRRRRKLEQQFDAKLGAAPVIPPSDLL